MAEYRKKCRLEAIPVRRAIYSLLYHGYANEAIAILFGASGAADDRKGRAGKSKEIGTRKEREKKDQQTGVENEERNKERGTRTAESETKNEGMGRGPQREGKEAQRKKAEADDENCQALQPFAPCTRTNLLLLNLISRTILESRLLNRPLPTYRLPLSLPGLYLPSHVLHPRPSRTCCTLALLASACIQDFA
eukprot:6204777-Pleurochrysis_carterae.AAC.9